MSNHSTLPSFRKLVGHLQKVPYLASKNLYRVVAYMLKLSSNEAEALCNAILQAHKNIRSCVICCNWVEGYGECDVCRDQQRDKSQICVIESCYDLFALEKIGVFRGQYHVLGGCLNPLAGVGPQNLTIDLLIKRLDGSVKELIFATNPTPEGEATASYIATLAVDHGVFISKLASGLPTGSLLEYLDRVTLHQAYVGRRPY